jgi:hypothetical protein
MTAQRPHAPTILAAMRLRLLEVERTIRQAHDFAAECRLMAQRADKEAENFERCLEKLHEEIGKLEALEQPANGQEGRNFSC